MEIALASKNRPRKVQEPRAAASLENDQYFASRSLSALILAHHRICQDYAVPGRLVPGAAKSSSRKEYDFDTLDVLSIPVFQWHQYLKTGTEPLHIVAINTRLTLENLGLSLTHQGALADY